MVARRLAIDLLLLEGEIIERTDRNQPGDANPDGCRRDTPNEAGISYTAAAKLELLEGQIPPYQVLQLYDDPPLSGENQQRNGLRAYSANIHPHLNLCSLTN